jgi:hypothetical protein
MIFLILSLSKDEENRAGSGMCQGLRRECTAPDASILADRQGARDDYGNPGQGPDSDDDTRGARIIRRAPDPRAGAGTTG